jgi:hypothetical protein
MAEQMQLECLCELWSEASKEIEAALSFRIDDVLDGEDSEEGDDDCTTPE